MLVIDGSLGEGGGQILRTALCLSLVTSTPVRLENIRAKRSRPGLLRQHVAAVKAAEAIGAEIEGGNLGSSEVVVRPGTIRGGVHQFAVGTAGSACLVLQTVLPALLAAGATADLRLEGGTHNPNAPPFDFLERVFVPVLIQMGATVAVELERPGFYPAGGGVFSARVGACSGLRPIELLDRGDLLFRRATVLLAHSPAKIAEDALKIVTDELGWRKEELQIREVTASGHPGFVLLLEVEAEHGREMCAGIGERGVRSDTLARGAARALDRYLQSGAPVGIHLADQLMVPFALAGGGCFRTMPLSNHSRTNLEVIQKFLPVAVGVRELGQQVCLEFSIA